MSETGNPCVCRPRGPQGPSPGSTVLPESWPWGIGKSPLPPKHTHQITPWSQVLKLHPLPHLLKHLGQGERAVRLK